MKGEWKPGPPTASKLSYKERDNNLKALGFATYADYLASDLWRKVRETVYREKGTTCTLCGLPAQVLHHNRYFLDDLKGVTLKHIHPVCTNCHTRVEFNAALLDEDGKPVKRNMCAAVGEFLILRYLRQNNVERMPPREKRRQLLEIIEYTKPTHKPPTHQNIPPRQKHKNKKNRRKDRREQKHEERNWNVDLNSLIKRYGRANLPLIPSLLRVDRQNSRAGFSNSIYIKFAEGKVVKLLRCHGGKAVVVYDEGDVLLGIEVDKMSFGLL